MRWHPPAGTRIGAASATTGTVVRPLEPPVQAPDGAFLMALVRDGPFFVLLGEDHYTVRRVELGAVTDVVAWCGERLGVVIVEDGQSSVWVDDLAEQRNLYTGAEGAVWAAGTPDGLMVFDAQRGQLLQFPCSAQTPAGLSWTDPTWTPARRPVHRYPVWRGDSVEWTVPLVHSDAGDVLAGSASVRTTGDRTWVTTHPVFSGRVAGPIVASSEGVFQMAAQEQTVRDMPTLVWPAESQSGVLIPVGRAARRGDDVWLWSEGSDGPCVMGSWPWPKAPGLGSGGLLGFRYDEAPLVVAQATMGVTAWWTYEASKVVGYRVPMWWVSVDGEVFETSIDRQTSEVVPDETSCAP